MLGAGFDARALRGKDFRWYELPTPTAKDLMEDNVLRFYEVDTQEIMDKKATLLTDAGMSGAVDVALGSQFERRLFEGPDENELAEHRGE